MCNIYNVVDWSTICQEVWDGFGLHSLICAYLRVQSTVNRACLILFECFGSRSRGNGGIKFRSIWAAGHYQSMGGRGWDRHARRWDTLPAVHGAGNTVERADVRRPRTVVAY